MAPQRYEKVRIFQGGRRADRPHNKPARLPTAGAYTLGLDGLEIADRHAPSPVGLSLHLELVGGAPWWGVGRAGEVAGMRREVASSATRMPEDRGAGGAAASLPLTQRRRAAAPPPWEGCVLCTGRYWGPGSVGATSRTS
eukprot:scaffold3919_cov117-Isochrysis_galbana.AAC.1